MARFQGMSCSADRSIILWDLEDGGLAHGFGWAEREASKAAGDGPQRKRWQWMLGLEGTLFRPQAVFLVESEVPEWAWHERLEM